MDLYENDEIENGNDSDNDNDTDTDTDTDNGIDDIDSETEFLTETMIKSRKFKCFMANKSDMSPSIVERCGDITKSEKFKSLMENKSEMSTEVHTSAMAKIDRELTPILAELLICGLWNEEHPAVGYLFNWLVDPQCTAENFNYIINTLAVRVHEVMVEHYYDKVNRDSMEISVYVGNISAEVLAVRCPVLKGPWETVAWNVYKRNKGYFSSIQGSASDRFSTWIISVIGDPDLCPSSDLRLQLIQLFLRMVGPNDQNHTLALKSVMFTLSNLKMDCYSDKQAKITHILEEFHEYLGEIDEKLAVKLQNDLNSRLSVMLHNTTYNHSAHPTIHTEPREVHAINNMLKITSGYIKECILKKIHWLFLTNIIHRVEVLFKSFKLCFQAPQLLDAASSCIMDLVELVLLVNVSLVADHREMSLQSLSIINGMLGELCDFNNTQPTSHLGRKIICRFSDARLKNLRIKLQEEDRQRFSMFSNLLHIGNKCFF